MSDYSTQRFRQPPQTREAGCNQLLQPPEPETVGNTSQGADNVFSDGEQYQLCTMTENTSIGGYDAALTVGVS